MTTRGIRAFTLIELLIVVAIIAILAAIAVPNFLEAQVRSKIARVRNDHRTLATALESYTVDNNRPPLSFWPYYNLHPQDRVALDWRHICYKQLTTPISYITSFLADPFSPYKNQQDPREESKYYYYVDFYPEGNAYSADVYQDIQGKAFKWAVYSVGPQSLESNNMPWVEDILGALVPIEASLGNVYDSTNGTKSAGKIFRTNKGELTGDGVKSCYP